jgi:hypothetical protein
MRQLAPGRPVILLPAMPPDVEHIAPNEVWHGDPTLCFADTGAALVDRLADIGAGLAARVASWDA